MFTRVHYLYRDGDNYKQGGDVLLSGEIGADQIKQIKASLDTDGGFIPAQIGWPHLGTLMAKFPDASDHCWHEMWLDDPYTFQTVSEPSTGEQVTGSVEDWVAAMVAIGKDGWDDATYGIGA